MRILGQWKPEKQTIDKTKYIAKCNNPECRCIIEFFRNEVEIVTVEGEYFKGELNRMRKSADREFYAIHCANCNEIIYLGETERDLMNYIKNPKQRNKEINRYDDDRLGYD